MCFIKIQFLFSAGSPTKELINPLQKPDRPPSSGKLSINNGTTANNNNINNGKASRKESFGSKDSLNDSGIITGNVAAFRKSLENKNLETTTPPEWMVRKSIEGKSTSEIRKSLENLDERKSTPPPVLTKKPTVPIKKSPTVGSVANNIFSGIKQKVKSVEQKITHHDSLDGVGASKVGSQVADNQEKGIIGERLKKERDDTEFDQVERSSILQDMRAGRAKAPKRRLPTTNSIGESVTYENGDSIPSTASGTSQDSKSDEDVAKPKQREWEKHKAPWMEELKASQAKKTSPGGTESRSPDAHSKSQDHDNEKFEMPKPFSNSFASSGHKKSTETNNFEIRSNSVDVKSSTAFDAFQNNNNNNNISNQTATKKDNENVMTKSMTSLATKISISDTAPITVSVDESSSNKVRPTSVTLRNRSISPIGRIPIKTINDNSSSGNITTSTATITSKNTISAPNNHDVLPPSGVSTTVLSAAISSDNVCSRVVELELRVQKLEKLVQKQNATIEELLKAIRDESDKVKILKHELEKYAQCVTQV